MWVLTGAGIDLLQVPLDQDGSSEGTFCELALGVSVGVDRHRASLLFDANEHLGEQEALELLPRSSVAADSQRAM